MKRANDTRGALPACSPADHPGGQAPRVAPTAAVLARAAGMLRAAGDPARLTLLDLLTDGECCVTTLAGATGDAMPAVSQRLRLLRTEGLVTARREGKHVFYALADAHVHELLANVLRHAGESMAVPPIPARADPGAAAPAPPSPATPTTEHSTMSTAQMHHGAHPHTHGPGCGHTGVQHDGHVDYLHDGHLHHQNGSGVEEHALAVGAANPSACTPEHRCGGHDAGHVHGAGCGHEAVPHGDHVDYLVDGHLHHPHGDHCDHHGALATVG